VPSSEKVALRKVNVLPQRDTKPTQKFSEKRFRFSVSRIFTATGRVRDPVQSNFSGPT